MAVVALWLSGSGAVIQAGVVTWGQDQGLGASAGDNLSAGSIEFSDLRYLTDEDVDPVFRGPSGDIAGTCSAFPVGGMGLSTAPALGQFSRSAAADCLCLWYVVEIAVSMPDSPENELLKPPKF